LAKAPVKENTSFANLGFDPDVYAGALAHVIKVETNAQGRRETVLGQAWLAGIGKLVTCGHVVEPHMQEAGSLIITFPYSGNRYPIKEIKLHPSFVKQPDGLVKFDAALLTVDLHEPELSAKILPIIFEKAMPAQMALTAVRYPVHLGQYSSASNPLAQSGRLLGALRKHDDFHLLHDTPLAPGDSGAPIFDGQSIVALHCGDTATLPGLNLPTTSIRLALWVDSLRELGIEGTMAPTTDQIVIKGQNPAGLLIAFWLTFLLSLSALAAYKAYPQIAQKKPDNGKIRPIGVTFDKPVNQYDYHSPASIILEPHSACYLYLYAENGPDSYVRIFPNLAKGTEDDPTTYTLNPGQFRDIDRVGNAPLLVDCNPMKFHLIALDKDQPPLKIGPSYDQASSSAGKLIDTSSEVKEALDMEKSNPGKVLEFVFESPVASQESRKKYEMEHPASAAASAAAAATSGPAEAQTETATAATNPETQTQQAPEPNAPSANQQTTPAANPDAH